MKTQQLTVTFAGHSAFIIEVGEKRIAVDPWLVGNPSCPETLHHQKALDLIVLTHGHSDHASDAVRVAHESGAQLVATYELAMIMIAEGVHHNQVVPMNKGGTFRLGSVAVTLTHALHSSSFDTRHGAVYAGEACGVVISTENQAVYHAGDTALFSDMKLIGERFEPDVALIPIGDRFTMGPTDAAQAASLLRCGLAIPMHYKTFSQLTGSYEEFSRECALLGVETAELAPGESRSF
jgi:L-ascorbate metabolism protein UlaG (beta-lactamase superfamily)